MYGYIKEEWGKPLIDKNGEMSKSRHHSRGRR